MQIISGIYAVLKREVKAILCDKLYLLSVVILPIVMMAFFAVMFHDGYIANLPIAIVDNDNTAMSRKLISMIDEAPGIEISSTASSVIEANSDLLKGRTYGYIVIPQHFEDDIVGSRPTNVDSYISATNLTAAGVLRRDIQQVVKTFSSGVAITRLGAIGIDESKVMAEVMPINIHTHTLANPYMNYGYYLAPIFMFVGIILFTMLTTIYAIGRELRYATAPEWMTAAYGSLPIALVGKLLPITVAMIVMMQLAMLVIVVIMGMEFMGSYPLFMLASLLFILAYQSIAVIVITITANMRLALSLGGGYAVMAFTFSGITFPISAMYGIAQLLSRLFPLTYFSRIFINEAMLGADAHYSLNDIGALLIFMLLVLFVWRRLGRVVRSSRYWGKD